MKCLKRIVLLFLLLSVSQVHAKGEGFYGFGGVDFGYAKVSEDSGKGRSGSHLDLKLLGSYYSSSVVFDLGIGWFYNEVDNSEATVETRSPFVEAVVKYRFHEQLNFGPLLMAAISNDNTFAANTNRESTEAFLGLRFDYEPPTFKVNKLRISGTLQRDFSISNRSVNIVSIGIQFGLPFKDKKVRVIEKEKIIYKVKNVPKVVKVGKNKLRATFDKGTGLYFKSNSDEANGKMVRYLLRLSHFLKKYSSEWESITVSGHTDNVGSLKYNTVLSERRALRVKTILVKEGMDASRIKTIGYAFKKPVAKGNSKAARAKNRRVEIDFNGVKNQDAFLESMSVIE